VVAITAPKNPPPPHIFKRVLRRMDMLLFTVCAVLIIDQLAASASIGTSAIFWWIFTLICFFIPYGMITAELASKYPEQGGIYAWVKHAFGRRWGARTSWLYWVNVALWMPSVYLLFSGMLAQILGIKIDLWTQIVLATALTWITVWMNIASLGVSKWVPDFGAILKVIIMLAIGAGGIWYAMKNGVANDLSWASMQPKWSDGLGFLPVIVYNFLGFELMSGASEEMRDPSHDVLSSILIAGVVITVFYLLGTIGILIALPLDQISLIEGLIDTLRKIFGDSAAASALVTALGIAALYTLYANMVTWTLGANRAIAEAAYRQDLPAVFGKLDGKNQTPRNAALITGVVSTVVIILYGFLATNAEDLFWTLFKFSTIVFLLPYLLMFPAFIQLRRNDDVNAAAYRMPGGILFGGILATICQVFIVQAIVLFVWVPGKAFFTYENLAIVIGTALIVVIGEILIYRTQQRSAPIKSPATS
jgi:glutamate:GABA antiporter